MARCAECTSLKHALLPAPLTATHMNQDGNAANGSPMASAPEGNGSVPSLRQLRRGGALHWSSTRHQAKPDADALAQSAGLGCR